MATVNLGRLKPVFKGAYNSGTAYVIDDIVTYANETYINIQAGTNQQPNTATGYWTKLASKGSDGTDLTSTLTTRGDIVFKGASALTRLPKGTAGYYLKQGANDPEWAELSGGDYVKLATHTVSSAVSAVSIDGNGSWIDNTVYGGYKFYIRNLSTSNDSGSSVVRFRLNFAGSAYSTANYYSFAVGSTGSSGSSSVGASQDWSSGNFGLSYNNMDAEESRSGYGSVELLNTGGDENNGSGAYNPNILSHFFSHHSNSSSLYYYSQMGYVANNAPVSGITIYPTGGNIDLGTITVYGRKK